MQVRVDFNSCGVKCPSVNRIEIVGDGSSRFSDNPFSLTSGADS